MAKPNKFFSIEKEQPKEQESQESQDTFVFQTYSKDEMQNNYVSIDTTPLENIPNQEYKYEEQYNSNYYNQNTININQNQPAPAMVDNTIKPNNMNENNMNQSVQQMQQTQQPTMQAQQPEPVAPPQTYVDNIDHSLNNATNPVPVNPIAPQEVEVNADEYKFESINIFSMLMMIIGIIMTPGITLTKYSKKYRGMNNALFFTGFITIASIILSIVMKVLASNFVSYNSISETMTIGYALSSAINMDLITYIELILLMSGGGILITSGIYYASSFLNNKGVSFGEYLMIVNLSFIPFLIGFTTLMPFSAIISEYLSILVTVICFLYTFIILITGINQALSFSTLNRKILYNLFNLSLIFVVIFLIVYIFFYGETILV